MTDFFKNIPAITYVGPDSDIEFGYRHYNKDEVILGKPDGGPSALCDRLVAQLRLEGGDPFGGPDLPAPLAPAGFDEDGKIKADVAFEMFQLLGVPFYCWHDADVRPETGNFATTCGR